MMLSAIMIAFYLKIFIALVASVMIIIIIK